MVLSLKDDVDDEVLEDAMFKEAEPFEVKKFYPVSRDYHRAVKKASSDLLEKYCPKLTMIVLL